MIEDIFSENLIDDPDDIERVIDGEERRDSERGSDDEGKKKEEEENKEKEKPKVRKKIGPRPVLNAQRLQGPRGIATMEEFFSEIQFDGRRGREEKDLDLLMKRLELWTHRLYPRGQFDDCLKKMEKLGTNKIIRNYITRIRLGMEDGRGESDIVRDEPNSPPPSPPRDDPFDQLVSSAMQPVAVSGPNSEITTEQRDRMLRNRLIAEERRAARIKKAQELKERFKAQQASNSQNLNIEVSNSKSQCNDNAELQQENSQGSSTIIIEGTVVCDVTNTNSTNIEHANEETDLYETNEEIDKEESQPCGNDNIDKKTIQQNTIIHEQQQDNSDKIIQDHYQENGHEVTTRQNSVISAQQKESSEVNAIQQRGINFETQQEIILGASPMEFNVSCDATNINSGSEINQTNEDIIENVSQLGGDSNSEGDTNQQTNITIEQQQLSCSSDIKQQNNTILVQPHGNGPIVTKQQSNINSKQQQENSKDSPMEVDFTCGVINDTNSSNIQKASVDVHTDKTNEEISKYESQSGNNDKGETFHFLLPSLTDYEEYVEKQRSKLSKDFLKKEAKKLSACRNKLKMGTTHEKVYKLKPKVLKHKIRKLQKKISKQKIHIHCKVAEQMKQYPETPYQDNTTGEYNSVLNGEHIQGSKNSVDNTLAVRENDEEIDEKKVRLEIKN